MKTRGNTSRDKVLAGRNWVVDAEIEAFFDRIDHGVLMRLVERRISDRWMPKLLRQMLQAGVLEGGEVRPTEPISAPPTSLTRPPRRR